MKMFLEISLYEHQDVLHVEYNQGTAEIPNEWLKPVPKN